MTSPHIAKRDTFSIFPILTVNFIGTLGYSIVMPFLIFLVTKFGGNAVVYGVLGATYSLFQLVGAPILGKYSDSYGRKPILLISQIGTLLAWVLFLVALMLPNIGLLNVDSGWMGQFTLTLPLLILFLGRALDGLTGGNISVANAYLVDVSSDANRKSNFGKMAASSNLGFILGPALAGILGATVLGEIAPTLAATAISLIAVFVIAWMLPEQPPTKLEQSPCLNEKSRRVLGKEIKDCYEGRPGGSAMKRILAVKSMPLMLVLYFLIFLAFNIFYTAFPIHAASGLNWEVQQLGIYFSFLSLVMIIIQGPVMSLIADRFSEALLVTLGSLFMFGSFLLLQYDTTPVVYAAAVMFAVGNGVMWPSFLSILGRLGSPRDQGYIQGVASSSGSLASIVGLVVGGLLYTTLHTTTFVVAAVIFLVVFALSFLLYQRAADPSS